MNETKRSAIAAVEKIARDVAAGLGLEIVEFVFHSRGRHSLLRIDIDRAGPAGVGVRDCEALAHSLDETLDKLLSVESPYELQVSSPGLDRPIRTLDDIRRNTGRPVRVEYRDAGGGVREFSGELGGTDESGRVVVTGSGDVVRIDTRDIVLMKQEVRPGGTPRTKG